MPPSLTHYVYCELFDPLGTWTNSIHIFFIRQRREGKNEGDPLIIKRAKCEKGQTLFRRSHHGRSYATEKSGRDILHVILGLKRPTASLESDITQIAV